MLTRKSPLNPGRLPPDMRRNRLGFAKAAGSFVPKLTAKAFERYGFHTAEMFINWPQIVGTDLALLCEPERIKWPRSQHAPDESAGRTQSALLILGVQSAHALDIEYRSGEIIDRINCYFGYRAIGSLKVVQTPARTMPSETLSLPKQYAKDPLPPTPAALDLIAQDGLKRAFSDLWASIARQRASACFRRP